MVLGVKMRKAESLFTPATGNEEQIFTGFLVARFGGKTIRVLKQNSTGVRREVAFHPGNWLCTSLCTAHSPCFAQYIIRRPKMLNFFQRFYCTVPSLISNTFNWKKLQQRRKNINTNFSFASVNESMDHGNAKVRFRLSEILFYFFVSASPSSHGLDIIFSNHDIESSICVKIFRSIRFWHL